jgi:molecular chaperone DnaK (HSP70)
MRHWPFRVISKDDKPHIRVTYKDEEKDLSPEQITAMILARMKQTAEQFIGKRVPTAIVTVPAFFDSPQRQAIMGVGAIAGFAQLRIINDSSATLGHNFDNKIQTETTLLVFSLGGGTLGIFIVTVDDSEVSGHCRRHPLRGIRF